ncbi:hypothetical protein FNH22_08245 [Fulvivirga sp. M361]|uniref:hypothetical protein n=1 Tax=Fulvivirga sp. M361 TaxID=2594266 RepID=UPI00117A6EE8|nr:hypothetical protein [Fulvivirga sp. M361]TRX60032.1 hypothetical protein FNH22_08245 [Fulvivirga sp. M361]
MKFIKPEALLLVIALGCNSKKRETLTHTAVNDTSGISISDTIPAAKKLTEVKPKEDKFTVSIKSFHDTFPGYSPKHPRLIDTLDTHQEHWLLRAIERKRQHLFRDSSARSTRLQMKLPTPEDHLQIEMIRQASFKGRNSGFQDVLMEEWTFKDPINAERWGVLLRDSLRGNEFTKPPRYDWVEGNKIYLVSCKSAGHWFEFSDTLVMQLSGGKTREQMNRIYAPLDLKHYKKWQGPAHSSVNNSTHLFSYPDRIRYTYYYFAKQHRKGNDRVNSKQEYPLKEDFHITTALTEPFTGNEQFNTLQESLVEIQCAIKESALNQLDIVNTAVGELERLFGPPIYQQNRHRIYGHANRIIVVKINNERVEAFKYMRLNDLFDTTDYNHKLLNNRILNFD